MFLCEYFTIVLPTHCIFKPWLYIYGEDVTYVLGSVVGLVSPQK